MKRILLFLLAAFMVAFVPACGRQDNDGTTTTSDTTQSPTQDTSEETTTQMPGEEHDLAEYYPFLSNVRYTYRGEGNEYASYTLQIDLHNESRVQTRVNNGGTETVNVIEIGDGKISKIFSRSECYYREGFLSKNPSMEDVLLKEPLVKGTEWTAADGSRRYISETDMEITTPAGTYLTIEVITEREGDVNRDYYAPQVGLLKSVWESDEGYVVTSTLSEIAMNHPLVQNIRFYYPNGNVDGLFYIDREISFITNDITRIVLQNTFKNLPEGDVAPVLTENTKINWLYLNADGMLYVDFSKELVNEMNAGTSYESLILASITNTLGEYYGVQKVYITVEGAPYSSGHIEMGRGEAFEVDTESAKPLQ